MKGIKIENKLILNGGIPEGYIITDENILRLYKKLFKGRKYFPIKPGEKSKNFDTYLSILEKLVETEKQGGIKALVAVGGGVVGDLAGFVASTYKRGIPFIQIPTSLMAMIDASIGGKNGLDFLGLKNFIGTFYQPQEILIDPDFLKTLPLREFKNGLAEIIKYGVILNKAEFLKKISITPKIISDCVKAKIAIVQKDEKDIGLRHCLNFGHTIGHAVELFFNLGHGEAVAIGMAKEAELAFKMEIFSKDKTGNIKKAIQANGLPIDLPKKVDENKLIDLMKLDKKGTLVFAFDMKHYSVKVKESLIKEILWEFA